jgi:hypothetical protein
MLLGGITACSDHNPTVVFTADAGIDGKSQAGASLDGGGSHDGGTVAEVAVAADSGGQAADASWPVDVAPEATPISDASNSVDLGVGPDLALDLNQTADSHAATDVSPAAIDLGPGAIDLSSAAIDGASPALDVSAGTSLEVGIDSSAVHDGGGTAG